jgi:hypothetical protein
MKTTAKTTTRTLESVSVKPIESQYSEGSWSGVRATLTYKFAGALDERGVLATGHRILADALDATPAAERWNLSVEVSGSYRDVVMLRLAVELADGSPAEMERAQKFLTNQTARAK